MSSRRLRIEHRTGYKYQADVSASFNEVRMTPLNTRRQFVLNHQLHINPGASVSQYVDYWGSIVHNFDVHDAHTMLEVVSVSTVDTEPVHHQGPGITWEELQAQSVQDRLCEYLESTSLVTLKNFKDQRAVIVKEMKAAATPADAMQIALASVQARITYSTGATNVWTTADQAWAQGSGVCQDYTQTMLSLLRASGIPARYVSGYLHNEHAQVGLTEIAESHAWVEYWNGDWEAIDPTNNRTVSNSHVIVARGRDYNDVAPLKGIYAGGQSETLGVEVHITEMLS